MSDLPTITVVVRPMLAAEPLMYGVPEGSWIVVAKCGEVLDSEVIQPAPGQTADELASLIDSDELLEVGQAKRRTFRRLAEKLRRDHP